MTKQQTLDRMRRLCSLREYCRRDIRTKVLAALAKGSEPCPGPEEACNEIIDTLCREGYLDENRYASAFARDKSSLQGWGPSKIRYALRAKGIDEEIITFALSRIDDGAARRKLEKVVETKRRSLGDDPRAREKLMAYLLGRGYAYEEVKEYLKYDNN